MRTQYTAQLAIKYTSAWHESEKGDRIAAIKEVVDIFRKYEDRVGLRGTYVVQGFQAHTDILFWMFADHFNDIQDLQLEIRRSSFGRYITTPHAFTGVTKPFEFSDFFRKG